MTKSSPRPLIPPECATTINILLGRKSENTQRAYRADLKDFQKYAKEESGPHALYALLMKDRVGAREWAMEYQEYLLKRMKLAQATVRRRLACLQAFVSEARKRGLVDWNLEIDAPTNMTDEGKRASGRRAMAGPKVDQLQQVRLYLQAQGTLAAKRDLAIISLLTNPMLRRAEVARLRVSDFNIADPDDATVRVIGKGRTEPEIMDLTRKTVEDLLPWLAARGATGDQPVFVQIKRGKMILETPIHEGSIYLITTKRGKQAGLKRRLRPHGLRHTGITEVANYVAAKGIPVTEGMAISRHKDAATFWGYVDGKGSKRKEILNAVSQRL